MTTTYYLRTGILLAALTGLFGLIGLMLGGFAGMVIALVFAAATNAFAFYRSDTAALNAYGSQQVDERSAPELVQMVNASPIGQPAAPPCLSDQRGQPNAFATAAARRHQPLQPPRGSCRC